MISALALDLGSTSIKAGLLDQQGRLLGIVSQPVPAVKAQEGRYESDALAYATTADNLLAVCLAQTEDRPPLGLCSQRSSFLIWEKSSGKPVTPLISWQDNRGVASCTALQEQEPLISELSGLRLTPYFFAPKLNVILQENPLWLEKLQSGQWLAGTLDTFLIWRWTSGRSFITDVSMAARTLLMDIRQQHWSPVLCNLFGIAPEILPEIRPSAGLHVRLDNGLTLQASLADQSAALLASVGDERDIALVNLGTGGFVIRCLADDNADMDGYLRTLVYQDNTGHAHFAAEGTLNSIAAALAPYPVADCRVDDFAANDIFCVAEPSGIGAPYFRKDLALQFSAPVTGLSQKEIACLLLEGIIFRVVRILEDFQREGSIRRVYLSGGLSELSCLQMGIAMCVPFDVSRLQQRDASLQGAAMLAAGMDFLHSPAGHKILAQPNDRLYAKFYRWKAWLDTMLIRI